MKKINLNIIVTLLIFLPLVVSAQENIDFPVSELGDCSSKTECESYCDDQSHLEECLDFSVKHGMMTEAKAKRIKAMSAEDFEGPGGCTTPEECKEYCDKEENQEECFQHSVDNGLITTEEAQRIRERVRQEIEGPGGCNSREECENYCSKSENVEECVGFSVVEGRMSQEEADKIIEQVQENQVLRRKRIEEKIEKKDFSFEEGEEWPGGCKTEEECMEYCSKPENIEECVNSEVEMGKLTQEEADKIIEDVKRRAQGGGRTGVNPDQVNAILQQTGGGPGGCMSQEECDNYCQNEENGEECVEFAKEHGLMPKEKAEKVKKQLEISKSLKGEGGPGGCTTSEECKEYCNQEENQEECINFGRQHGMITAEKAQQLQQKMEMMKEGGPGGCKSKEECNEYCSKEENQEECINFGKEHGMITAEKAKEMQVLRRRVVEKRKIIEQKGMLPQNTEVKTEKGGIEKQGGMPSKSHMSGKNIMPSKDMMPTDNMNSEGVSDVEKMENVEEQMEKEGSGSGGGFGPQSLLDSAKLFLANIGFIGLMEK